MNEEILRSVTTVALPPLPPFAARNHFEIGTSHDARVRIAFISDDSDDFGSFLNKVEEESGEVTLAVHRLEKASPDIDIMNILGVENLVIRLAHFYELLKSQGRGQTGPLLVNGYANIAYIEDKSGVVQVVLARWDMGLRGWDIDAFSLKIPGTWYIGCQVISRLPA